MGWRNVSQHLLITHSAGGQRICVGSTFALIEAILAAVGQHYQFTVDPDAVIDIKPQITLLPANGIPATLECRSSI